MTQEKWGLLRNKLLKVVGRNNYTTWIEPLEFKELTRIGDRIDSDYEQMQFVGGYDHNYVINKEKSTHTIGLKVLNANGYEEFEEFKYNRISKQVVDFREAIVIPNLSYKVSF